MNVIKINSSASKLIFCDFTLEKLYKLENKASLKFISHLKSVLIINYIHY